MLNKDSFKKTELWLEKHSKKKLFGKKELSEPSIPDEMWKSCPGCRKVFLTDDVKENMEVCPGCGYHFRLSARRRLEMLIDNDSWNEFDQDLKSSNIISFPDYDKKISRAEKSSGELEAVISGMAAIYGIKAVVCVMESAYIMGSMGTVVGEKIVRAFEYATENKLPVIVFCASGGARMQEGILSLMQMAKTSGAVKRHSDAGLLYVSFLTNPTTGGVTASFAMEGDIIVSEPGALIGFAGPRVIEQTIKQKLPEGFQSAEFLIEKGFLDAIVKRSDMKQFLSKVLKLHVNKEKNSDKAAAEEEEAPVSDFVLDGDSVNSSKSENIFLSPYDQVKSARDKNRPTSQVYIRNLFTDFIPFSGDRRYADDKAVLGGIAKFGNISCTVIGLEKGLDTKEKILRNFGCAHPEGYRKSLRLMKQAEKFKRPVICFIDTAGAFCGIAAEERGQGQAIAENLMEMMALKIPVLSILIGEGGSGGALALGVANEVWMMENSVYSVISPEGCASILWKDSSKVEEAARSLKLTANDLLELGVIEQIVKFGNKSDLMSDTEKDEIKSLETKKKPESKINDYADETVIFEPLRNRIREFLDRYNGKSGTELAEIRYRRFRKF